MNIILASQSPRRKDILEKAGYSFLVYPSSYEEIPDPFLSPIQQVSHFAHMKAKDVAKEYDEGFIIGADTIVEIEGKILMKPKDSTESLTMLQLLQGKTHSIHSAAHIILKKNGTIAQETPILDTAKITFNPLTIDKLQEYILNKQPFDKAGSYGIQDVPTGFIKETFGSYNTILGLPIEKMVKYLPNGS